MLGGSVLFVADNAERISWNACQCGDRFMNNVIFESLIIGWVDDAS